MKRKNPEGNEEKAGLRLGASQAKSNQSQQGDAGPALDWSCEGFRPLGAGVGAVALAGKRRPSGALGQPLGLMAVGRNPSSRPSEPARAVALFRGGGAPRPRCERPGAMKDHSVGR